MGKKGKGATLTEAGLAKHWGVTERYVRMMADEEIAVRCDGGYDALESDRRLIGWLRRDEPTQRAKRELLKWKQLDQERKLEEKDRRWLTLTEVRRLIDDAWSVLYQVHVGTINANYSAFSFAFGGDDEKARIEALRLSADVKAQLRQAQALLEGLYGGALAKMDCELRNGILRSSRRIRGLQVALGESDAEEARDYDERIGKRARKR